MKRIISIMLTGMLNILIANTMASSVKLGQHGPALDVIYADSEDGGSGSGSGGGSGPEK